MRRRSTRAKLFAAVGTALLSASFFLGLSGVSEGLPAKVASRLLYMPDRSSRIPPIASGRGKPRESAFSEARSRRDLCPASTSSFSIAICGNRFTNQFGHTIVLRGVNTEGPQYDCADPGAGFYDDPTISPNHYSREIRAMKAWGINVVRVNLNEQCWLAATQEKSVDKFLPSTTFRTGFPAPAGDHYDKSVNAYMHEMGDYVAAFNAAGIYTEIDLHLNAPDGEMITDLGTEDFQNPLPDSYSLPFWKSVAAYFAHDHAVIFGVFNEPYPPNAGVNGDTKLGWSCDVNGCTVPDYTATPDGNDQIPAKCPAAANPAPRGCYRGEGMKQLIAAIREYNSTAPLLVGGPSWAGDVDEWLRNFYPGGNSIDPSHELAMSVHIYFPNYAPCALSSNIATACPTKSQGALSNDGIEQVAKVAPVEIDEVGSITCTHGESTSTSLAPFLASVDAADVTHGYDIGYEGWAWTTHACDPNLIRSWTSGAPSPMGADEYCELLAIGLAPSSNSLFSAAKYCPSRLIERVHAVHVGEG